SPATRKGALPVQRTTRAVASGASLARPQGNRTSELGEEAGKVVVLPSGEFELAPQGGLGVVLAHDIESQMAQDGEIVGAVVQAVAGLIFIHDDVEAPVQPVLDAPMRAYDSVAARGGQGGAEQVIGGLGRGFGGEFAGSDDLGNGGQSGPPMLFLQPSNIGADHSGAGFDPPVVALDRRVGGRGCGCARKLRVV